MEIAIPCHIERIEPADEKRLQELFRRFGNARRRAYNLRRKGIPKKEIERHLQREQGINSRYVKDAYYSIKDIPAHWTCGGLKNQRIREKGKISKSEYNLRRNSTVVSRGDKSKKGNLNTRLDLKNMEMRIAVPPVGEEKRAWIYPRIFMPKKYLKKYGHLLSGKYPYAVYLKRKDNDRGYGGRVVVDVPDEEVEQINQRLMVLDVNAGHIAFAVADPHRVLTVGDFNVHETQYASTNKRDNLLHHTVKKITNIARHYKAKIVMGKLNTAKYRGRGARKIKGIPHYKLYHILSYKFEESERYSEAYTSKLAGKIMGYVGYDIHKVSACMFALKVLDYKAFSSLKDVFLRGVCTDEGEGSQSAGRTAGSELTAPHQASAGGDAEPNGPVCDDAVAIDGGGYPAIPGSWGNSSFLRSMRNDLPCLQVKIC